jgi:ubiquinone/menaquinone biosynthesis C-methylase UbiE
MSDPLVNTDIQQMYDGYYAQGDGLFRKREITAIQTFDHVKSVWDSSGKKPDKIIDVGAGEGSFLCQLSENDFADNLYGVEISSSGIETIQSKKIDGLRDIKKFDGYSIPYEDNFFDLAFSIHVLEHVEHERLFLNELKRVSKKVIIEVPLEHTFTLQKSIDMCRPSGHINFYTVGTFKNLLETCGFNCLKFQIFPISKELECFVSGTRKGTFMNYIRSTILSSSPRLATSMMTYMCTAYCETQ